MLIAGLFSGYHDASACLFDDYDLVASVALERMTRVKADGHRLPVEALDECLETAAASRRDVGALVLDRTSYPVRFFRQQPIYRRLEAAALASAGRTKKRKLMAELARLGERDACAIFDEGVLKRELGLSPGVSVRFFNHHFAHALPTLFHTDWDDALLYTADGGGDNVQYSHRLFRDGKIETLSGGEDASFDAPRVDSLGRAYSAATRALGYKANRHEGKLTGLAAFGEPVLADEMSSHFTVDEAGRILSDFVNSEAMEEWFFGRCRAVAPADAAASIQKVLEDVILTAVGRLVERTSTRNLGLAGGVFANVRLNQRLAEELPVDEVFIYPAMSDQGLAAGGVLQYLLERDGLEAWLDRRQALETLYLGRDYGGAIDDCLGGDARFSRLEGEPADVAAGLLADGGIVAIYTRGMEHGPRALGARSILASPADARINDTLNQRLSRTEFMPFAPVVSALDANEVFDIGPVKAYAARFMTITARTHDRWRERIPAVVHVDGTARPQVIEREENPLYFDILSGYKARTGLPVLINTSFNAHEEPIINSPGECARALADGRIDYVVTDRAVYAGPAASVVPGAAG